MAKGRREPRRRPAVPAAERVGETVGAGIRRSELPARPEFLCRALLQPLDALHPVDRASRRPHRGRRSVRAALPRRRAHAHVGGSPGNSEASDHARLRYRRDRRAGRQRHHDRGAQFPAQSGHAAARRLCRREAPGAVASGLVIRFYGAFAAPEPKDPPVTSAKGQAAAAAEKPASAAHPSIRALERPANLTGTNAPGFGSDVVADTLRALQIPYIALNPGASYRGLHDSIVNFLGNETPQMLLCLHEESAVAIAHGYAKVTGKAMAAAVHSNVGLFHATMAMFNAWCDRFPVIVLGATGPVDAAKRRPWIDWIHTARDQGAIVRNYTKWDDQPASPAAAREAIIRATWIANTAPMGPVYINLDAEMQENKLAEPLPPIDVKRYQPLTVTAADPELVTEAAALLKAAKRPVILMGRVSRSLEGWNERVALAEAVNAKVITELKLGAAFPTDHPQHAGAPGGTGLGPDAQEAVRNADVIMSLDWVDLAGAFKATFGDTAPQAKVIVVSSDFRIHNGWSMDYQGLPPADVLLPVTPEEAVPDLLEALGGGKPKPAVVKKTEIPPLSTDKLVVNDLVRALKTATGDRDITLAHISLSWDG